MELRALAKLTVAVVESKRPWNGAISAFRSASNRLVQSYEVVCDVARDSVVVQAPGASGLGWGDVSGSWQ